MGTFLGRLRELVGKSVSLERGGPHAMQGTLLAVKSDYLSVGNQYGSIVHVPARHVKSVGQDVAGDSGSNGYVFPRNLGATLPETFSGLVATLRGTVVQVNEDGPEKVSGLLADVAGDHLQLISNQGRNQNKNQNKNQNQNQNQQGQRNQNNQSSQFELVHCPLTHIRSIRVATEVAQQQENSEQNQQAQSSDSGGGGRRLRVATGRHR